MPKKIIQGDDVRDQLLEGAQLLYEAVSATMGPKGRNVAIEAYGEPVVTHDGVTVAKSIEDLEGVSSGARVGIEMIKASSSKTNDNVGDGTTSSTVLAYHLMKDGFEKIKVGKNPMVLRRELDEATKTVLDILPTLSEPLKTEKQTIEVATISCEDPEIGKQIGKMYYKLGKNPMVVVEMGTKPYNEYEIVEGYTFDRGLASPLAVQESRTQTTTVKTPGIYVTDKKVVSKDVAQLVGEAYNSGKDAVVIIAAEFSKDFLDDIAEVAEPLVVPIKAPGFGDKKKELLKDIATFVGTKVNSVELGTCEQLVATEEETVITGGSDVTSYINDLTEQSKQTKGSFDKSKLEKRIAALRAKVGYIRVGGNTEMEAEDRKYMVDDAVAATEAALKDGIVPGGGTTYLELSKRLDGLSEGHSLLKEALTAPFKVLMTNAGERYGKKLEELAPYEFGKGFDVMGDGSVVDLKEHGVIDPALVIKQTITNATSVAGSALTTGVIISREKEDTKDD